MIKFYSAMIFFGILFSIHSLSAELFRITQANLSFDTFIRVETPAKIIESDDPSLLGSSLSFHQSLRYSGSKVLQLNRNFSSMDEIKQYAESELCQEIHTQELKPIRESGTKASKHLNVRMKPKTILLVGIHVSGKGSPISISFTCN